MMKELTLGALVLLSFCGSTFIYAEDTESETPVVVAPKNIASPNDPVNTAARKNKINAIIHELHAQEGVNLHDGAAQELLFEKLVKEVKIPLIPNEEMDKRSLMDLQKEVSKEIIKQFPKSLAKMRQDTREEATKKFILIKEGDKITLNYTQGRRVKSATGVFKGFINNGKQISIGLEKIPVIDVSKDDLIRFSESRIQERIDEYVEDICQDYNQRRIHARDAKMNFIKIEQQNKNEELGYLYQNGNWITMKALALDLISKLDPKIDVEEKPIVSIDPPDTNNENVKNPAKEELIKEDVARLVGERNKAIKAWMDQRIKTEAGEDSPLLGVDTLPGFTCEDPPIYALWARSQKEDMPFFQNINAKVTADAVEFDLKEKLSQVKLNYYKGYLISFEEKRLVKSIEIGDRLILQYRESFGLTDAEKAQAKAEEEANKDPNKKPAQKEEKKTDSKENEKVEQRPQEQILEWTGMGQLCKVILHVRLNEQLDSIESFTLQCENLLAKGQIDDAEKAEEEYKRAEELKKQQEEESKILQ